MKSPFPGTDSYIEARRLRRDFHDNPAGIAGNSAAARGVSRSRGARDRRAPGLFLAPGGATFARPGGLAQREKQDGGPVFL
jgi:hypothetical protein